MLDSFLKKINEHFPVSPDFEKDFLKKARLLKFKKDDVLVRYGTVHKKTYFIVTGSFKSCMQTPNGDLQTVWFYFDELFYIIPVLDSFILNGPTKYEILAMEESVVIEMDDVNFEFWSSKYPEFSKFTMMDMIKDFMIVDDIRSHLICYSKKDFLSYLSKAYPIIINSTPCNTVADFMGITPEWYSKIKKKIKL
jgi:CRP-like cAMP-binding protein